VRGQWSWADRSTGGIVCRCRVRRSRDSVLLPWGSLLFLLYQAGSGGVNRDEKKIICTVRWTCSGFAKDGFYSKMQERHWPPALERIIVFAVILSKDM